VPRALLLQQALAPEDLARVGGDSCRAEDALCVPERWLDTPRAPPERCRAAGDLEARCLPNCLPDVAKRAGDLQQRSCQAGELCVPCFDPRSGEDSGASRVGADQPEEPPCTFGSCCDGRGRCVPREVLLLSAAASDLTGLGNDVCAGADNLCVPQPWLATPRPTAAPCRAPGDLEGRCMSTCLPRVAGQAGSLQRASCADGELCAP
jgi:hypothetical protein